MPALSRMLIAGALVLMGSQARAADGFVLKAGLGERLHNGIVVKASPKTGTSDAILVEQTFHRNGSTPVHIHDQGDELFYVVSGRGTARLGDGVETIEAGDVLFAPAGAVHQIANLKSDDPLRVVFFMASPELVEEFRAIHERITKEALVTNLLGPVFGKLKSGIRTTVENTVAENDFVVVQSRGQAETLDGRPYNNTYCHVFRVTDGRIAEVTEYLDTELASSVLCR